ncbi:anion permease [uncultured Paracoccus sp.]|uniref:inorganic phosphate transporter n=1 Tax=uncultured Paracoccus sp. TaxID=189685 RepID=UPI002627B60F|nr:anion permease [uncultured Paracoccus sp.]
MARRFLDLRTLDKDLGRLSAAERAGLHSTRPLLRLGAAVLFVAAMAMLGTAALSGQATLATAAAGVALAAYLALAIGANDVTNSLAPAVGAGAIRAGLGLSLVALAEIAGAVLAGDRVSTTLSLGIVDPALMLAGHAAAPVMLAALLAAALWISLATWAGAPVSTTHSVVGGIAGAGLATFGAQAVNWSGIALIAGGWVVSPAVAGLVAALLLAVLRQRVDLAPDRHRAARRWLPGLVGLMAALIVLYVGAGLMGQNLRMLLPVVAAATGLAAFAARRTLDRQGPDPATGRARLDRLFGIPLVLAALLMGFAHGANDASNVTAPLWLILQAASPAARAASGAGVVAVQPGWVTLVAGAGLALGAVLFGRRLVDMVGSKITRLNPVRAFCVSLATAIVVLAASWLGLPVSTTHVAVGGVFGVGFYREWEDMRRQRRRKQLPPEEVHRRTLVRRVHVRRILFAWAITLPVAAALAALFAAVMM